MTDVLTLLLCYLIIGVLGGFVALNVGSTAQDKKYRAMRKAQGYEI